MPSTRYLPSGFMAVDFRHLPNYTTREQTFGLAFQVATPSFTQEEADHLSDAYVTIWGLYGGAGITFTGLHITVADAGGDPFIYVTQESGPPNDAQTLLPANCAVLIDKNTGRAGRRNRGRMFVPGASESETDGAGTLNPAAITRWQGFADAVFGLANEPLSGTGDAVILHSYEWEGVEDPGTPFPFPAPTDIISLTVDPMIGTQRRRMR